MTRSTNGSTCREAKATSACSPNSTRTNIGQSPKSQRLRGRALRCLFPRLDGYTWLCLTAENKRRKCKCSRLNNEIVSSVPTERGVRQVRPTICFFVAMLLGAAAGAQAQTIAINFDTDKAGDSPNAFTTTLTGRGKPGVWVVMKDDTAPSKSNVLAQTDADTTGYRFP